MDARTRRTTSWPRMHSYAAVTSSAGNRALLLLIVLAVVCHTFGYRAAEDRAYHAGETLLREKFESVQARMKAMLKTKARLLSHPVRTLAFELTRLETRDSSDDGSNADDGMSVESLDSDGQTGLDWDRTAGPNIPVATKPPGGDTTPGTCIVCENVLLISQDALAEFIRLFETFESDSMQQISVVTTDLNAQRGLRCGRIRRTDGNTALIQFEQSAINITVNDTFAPLGVLRSFHDSAFVEGVGALRTILNVVTGETSRQVQRTRSGPFVDFPPTVEVRDSPYISLVE